MRKMLLLFTALTLLAASCFNQTASFPLQGTISTSFGTDITDIDIIQGGSVGFTYNGAPNEQAAIHIKVEPEAGVTAYKGSDINDGGRLLIFDGYVTGMPNDGVLLLFRQQGRYTVTAYTAAEDYAPSERKKYTITVKETDIRVTLPSENDGIVLRHGSSFVLGPDNPEVTVTLVDASGTPVNIADITALVNGRPAAVSGSGTSRTLTFNDNMYPTRADYSLTVTVKGEGAQAASTAAFTVGKISVGDANIDKAFVITHPAVIAPAAGQINITTGADISAFVVRGGGSLTLGGRGGSVVIDGRETPAGVSKTNALVLVTDGGELTLADGAALRNNTLTAGKNTQGNTGAGVYVRSGAKFTMSGGEISGNRASGTAGVLIGSKGTFEMRGGTISGNTSSGSHAAGVEVSAEAEFTMSGGTISGSTSSGDGGGVYVDSSGTFTMSGSARIADNTAANGAGVYVRSGAKFTMSGGEISGNRASTAGGGVYAESTFTVSGSPHITGNSRGTDGTANNVYLRSGIRITCGSDRLADGNIGVSVEEDRSSLTDPREITSGWEVNCGSEGIFTADDAELEIDTVPSDAGMELGIGRRQNPLPAARRLSALPAEGRRDRQGGGTIEAFYKASIAKRAGRAVMRA